MPGEATRATTARSFSRVAGTRMAGSASREQRAGSLKHGGGVLESGDKFLEHCARSFSPGAGTFDYFFPIRRVLTGADSTSRLLDNFKDSRGSGPSCNNNSIDVSALDPRPR